MATAQDTRERQGFSSTAAPPSDDASTQSASMQSGPQPNTPGDPDSTFPQSGATDRSEPGTANYRPQGAQDGEAGANGGGDGTAGTAGGGDANAAGSGQSADSGNAGDDTSGTGGQSAGDTGGAGNTAGDDSSGGATAANGSGDDSGGGLLGGDGGVGGGLIQDAVTDTQTLAGNAVDNTGSGADGIVGGAISDAGNLLDNAAGNLGLGDGIIGDLTGGLPGGGIVGGITDSLGNGIDLGNVLGSGPALTAGVLGDGNGAIAQPVSELTGGLTDGILSPTGDGPIVDLGVVGDGSPAATGLLNDLGNDTLSGLGLGRIAEVNGNDSDASATVGTESGQNGPIVGAQAFSGGDQPSNNLIDLGAGPNGSNAVMANVLGGSADGSNPQADANLIDVGPNGQTAANADVLTSPDQFQFPVLDGAGTDALAGVLGTQGGAVASLVPDAGVPAVDIGSNPIVDVDLSGNADAGQTQNPLQAALNGQLLGTA